ncbi:MAG: putative toxin-antitoxin system toxin component, PIN family [Anaerolineae bacterium]
MRIVIDTNVWVSGLLWKGDAWRLLKQAEEGSIELCIAYPMLLELEEVLNYDRLQPRLAELQQTPARLVAYALSISTAFDVSRRDLPIVAADPDDDIFLTCAIAARAGYIVTADRHLLALKAYEQIEILHVEEFLQRASETLTRSISP